MAAKNYPVLWQLELEDGTIINQEDEGVRSPSMFIKAKCIRLLPNANMVCRDVLDKKMYHTIEKPVEMPIPPGAVPLWFYQVRGQIGAVSSASVIFHIGYGLKGMQHLVAVDPCTGSVTRFEQPV